MKRTELVKKSKRIVIKIGTRVITDSDGTLDAIQIERLVSQIASLKERGLQVIIVTSGAIGAGIAQLGLKHRPQGLSQLQACAAVGQSQLMQIYNEEFKKRHFVIAQILLTAEDLRSRTRYLNARNTVFSLLDEDVIPIVNENDTVAVDEIKFGDNDRLSALVTNLVQADLLVILSDVDGLYNDRGDLIGEVTKITREIEDWCKKKRTKLGTGGMFTKIEAAKIVTRIGEGMIVANGKRKDVIIDIFSGEHIGTFFEPIGEGLAGKKQWLAFFAKPQGNIIVDKGAHEVLVSKGKSLLAAGIIEIKGNFKVGDIVSVTDSMGTEFARGLVSYSSEEITKIKGLKTSQIHTTLGYKSHDEIIHRNNIVIL